MKQLRNLKQLWLNGCQYLVLHAQFSIIINKVDIVHI